VLKPNYKAALDLRKLGEERGSLLQRLGGMVRSLRPTELGLVGRHAHTSTHTYVPSSLPPTHLLTHSHAHTDRELAKTWHGRLFDPPGCGSQALLLVLLSSQVK
jgi:hypothetical protein